MHFASVIARGFSVVTTLARTCGMAWHLAEIYGMKRFCRNVRTVEIPVLDLADSKVTFLLIWLPNGILSLALRRLGERQNSKT